MASQGNGNSVVVFESGGIVFQGGELRQKGENEEEAVKYVWEGAIPLQIHLHESEVASHPVPPPSLVLGYLPLLAHLIKPYFKDSLPPPGEDSIWFDYKGVPLKWYVIVNLLVLLCV